MPASAMKKSVSASRAPASPNSTVCGTVEQESFSAYLAQEEVSAHFDIPEGPLWALKQRDHETRPYFKDDVVLP